MSLKDLARRLFGKALRPRPVALTSNRTILGVEEIEPRITPALTLDATVNPSTVTLGSPIQVSGNVISSITMTSLATTFDWNEPNVSDDTINANPNSTLWPISWQHTYATAGSYVVDATAKATYADGTHETATGAYQVTVQPNSSPPPVPDVRIGWVQDAAESTISPPPTNTIGEFIVIRETTDLSQSLVVQYMVYGSATAGTDYQALSGSVEILPGNTSAPIYVTAIDDLFQELTESVTVTLTWLPTIYHVLSPAGIAHVNLLDNEQAPVGNGTGLFGRYYNADNLTNVKLARIDETVNANWGLDSPSMDINPDHFSARWTGKVQPCYSGEYTFTLTADDGVRLWVNGIQLIDEWNGAPNQPWPGKITLTAGEKYDIKIEYRENLVAAAVKLEWSHAMQTVQIIPKTQLYPDVSTVGDRVWFDTDRDGVQDAEEPGAGNVRVRIEDATGNDAVPFAITSGAGAYQFLVPADKSYKIQYLPGASGDAFSPQNAASAELDSDAGADGYTILFTSPAAGGSDLTRDAGLAPVKFDLDVNANGALGDPVDGAIDYLPGYLGGVPVVSTGKTYSDQVYHGQYMKLILEGIGTSNPAITKVDFQITDVTSWAGYAANKSSPSVEGPNKHEDYSFEFAANKRDVSISRAQMGADKTMVDFFAKDYGGGANIAAKVYVQDGAGSKLSGTYFLKVPLDTDGDAISDAWQQSMVTRWQAQYGGNPAKRPFGVDDLEEKNPDDAGPLVDQKDVGDAHEVLEEYRGYILDGGGVGTFTGGHIRLDPARKEVLLEVDRAQTLNNLPGTFDGMLAGAAKVLSDPARGAGLHVYWVVDQGDLTLPENDVNTFAKVIDQLAVNRSDKLNSDFLHLLFFDKGAVAAEGAPAFAVDHAYPLPNRGAVLATTDVSEFESFSATILPKREELFACTLAHEIVHLLMDTISANGFDHKEHSTDPDPSDGAGLLKDFKCLMFSASTTLNREFANVRLFPVVQVQLDVRQSKGIVA